MNIEYQIGMQKLNRKKMAFMKQIRRNQIDQYFQKRRADLIEFRNNEEEQTSERKSCQQLIQHIPTSIKAFLQFFQDNFMMAKTEFIHQIQQIQPRVAELDLIEWFDYMYIVTKIMVNQNQTQLLERLITFTLGTALNRGKLLRKINKISENKILECQLVYLFRMGKFIRLANVLEVEKISEILHKYLYTYANIETQNMSIEYSSNAKENVIEKLFQKQQSTTEHHHQNQLKQHQISNCKTAQQSYEELEISVQAIKRLEREHDLEHYEYALLICNNFIAFSVEDKQNQENIKQQDIQSLQMQKLLFIRSVFYQDKEILFKIIRQAMLCVCQIKEQKILFRNLDVILRLLVNITHFLIEAEYFYIFLEAHIEVLMMAVFSLEQMKGQSLIYCLRLLNNISVTSTDITVHLNKELVYLKPISHYQKMYGMDSAVELEIIELFINVVHFINDEILLLRELIEKGMANILMNGLKVQNLEEQTLQQLLSALLIVVDADPFRLKRCLREEYFQDLKRIAEQSCECHALANNLLLSLDYDRSFQENNQSTSDQFQI